MELHLENGYQVVETEFVGDVEARVEGKDNPEIMLSSVMRSLSEYGYPVSPGIIFCCPSIEDGWVVCGRDILDDTQRVTLSDYNKEGLIRLKVLISRKRLADLHSCRQTDSQSKDARRYCCLCEAMEET